jgi:hypothetical protein
MSANINTTFQTIPMRREINASKISLPIEHGSWGFLFEPLLAATLLVPVFSSLWIALLCIGAFLLRQPIKVFLADKFAKRNLPQTTVAMKFILIYGLIHLLGVVGCLLFVKTESFLPFAIILPFAVYQIYVDSSKRSRELIPELTGAIAISSSSAVIALAGGWNYLNAFALWLIFVCRLIPSILYVRNRLRLEKGKEFTRNAVVISHFFALIIIGILAVNFLIPRLPLIMFFVLTLRAIWGLSPYRKKVKAMKIGVWEVIYGTLTALSVVFGYYLNL